MRAPFLHLLDTAMAFVVEPSALVAWATWPVFSVTSFRILSRLKRFGVQPKIILDVGANVGQFAVAAGKVFSSSTVYAFEPIPECFARLTRAVSGMPSVHVRNIALGAASGRIDFYVNRFSPSSSALRIGTAHQKAFPHAVEEKKINVGISTLDEVCAEITEGPILLKVDVQGYEEMVLRGAKRLLQRVDYLVVELSFQPLYEEEPTFERMIALLREQGLELTCAVDLMRDPNTGVFLQVDGLFTRRYSVSGRSAGDADIGSRQTGVA